MVKIGLIGGSGFLGFELVKNAQQQLIRTVYGNVEVWTKTNIIFLQRHQAGNPPHMINHRANLMALKNLGVEIIIAAYATGSLKENIRPGELVIVDDFIQLSEIMTFFDKEMKFSTPSLDPVLRDVIIKNAEKLGMKHHKNGILIHTRGPRYETKAEVAFFSKIADIAGMTLGNEATLASELGIRFAAIASVDNYANGISDTTITQEQVEINSRKNFSNLKLLIESVIDDINGEDPCPS